jgi:hypothetical protein
MSMQLLALSQRQAPRPDRNWLRTADGAFNTVVVIVRSGMGGSESAGPTGNFLRFPGCDARIRCYTAVPLTCARSQE